MGRTVLAEQSVSEYFTEILKSKKFRIGLIIGQSCLQREYVVHVAGTPEPRDEEHRAESERQQSAGQHNITNSDLQKEEMSRLEDVDDGWIAEHSKQVTKMLPGGVSVIGIFIVGTDDPFQEVTGQGKVRRILTAVQSALVKCPFLHGDNGNKEKIVLYVCSMSHKYVCRTIDVSSLASSARPADWKYQPFATRWHQLDCPIMLDFPYPLSEEQSSQSLWKQIQAALIPFGDAVAAALCLIDEKLRADLEPLDLGEEKRGKRKWQPHQEKRSHAVDLLLAEEGVTASSPLIKACGARMRLCGLLHGRAYVHQRATVGQAIEAVKLDLLRSLAARCEMHCDSLVGEDGGTQEVPILLLTKEGNSPPCSASTPIIHEPPRRMFVPLPGSQIAVSDYLFPGEGPQDSLESFVELLDLHVTEEEVQDHWETPADPADIESSEPDSDVSSVEDFPRSSARLKCSITSVVLSCIVVLLGIAISYLSLQGPH